MIFHPQGFGFFSEAPYYEVNVMLKFLSLSGSAVLALQLGIRD